MIPVLAGPTAVGKTAISLQLADALRAEIISADSRQVYRELNIGTAKPSPDELARVPHHFVNERSLGEPFSAGIFAREATRRMQDILGRGHVPLVVGGSTLYLYALTHGLADVPETPPDLREGLQARLAQEGPEALYRELERLDPAYAATMDATKTQRLIRALEVYYGTGRPLSDYFKADTEMPFTFRTLVLTRDRDTLYERIDRRVDEMIGYGLVDEVHDLLNHGADPSDNALQTIGYREPIQFLQGEISRDEMVHLIQRNTRRYAKRQLTWFRRFPTYRWLDLGSADLVDVVSHLQ